MIENICRFPVTVGLLGWLCLFTPPAHGQTVTGEQGQLTLSVTKEVVVSETPRAFSQLSNLDFFPDGSFVVTSSDAAQVILFSATGEQIRTIGRRGGGPFEYDFPGVVRAVGNEVWVYDQNALKMIRYGRDSQQVEELKGFNTGIRDFRVFSGGESLAVYIPNSRDFVRIYDVKSQGYLVQHGDEAVLHSVLLFSSSVGRLAVRDNRVYFGSPLRPEVVSVDTEGKNRKAVALNDASFSLNDPGWDTVADVNAHINEVAGFLFTNSSFSGVIDTKDWLVAVTENGKFSSDDVAASFNLDYDVAPSDRRRLKLDVITPDLELVDTFHLDPSLLGLRLLATVENQLVFYSEAAIDGGADIRRTLTFVEINNAN